MARADLPTAFAAIVEAAQAWRNIRMGKAVTSHTARRGLGWHPSKRMRLVPSVLVWPDTPS